MLFFGHVGITAGVVQGLSHATRKKIDLRKAVLLGLLPDLVDKPVGLLYPNVFGNHTRLWGHSILASLLALSLLLHWRRRFTTPLVYYFCFVGHFLLDRVWINDLYALFWPLVTDRAPIPITILEKWHKALFEPWNIFGETLGLGVLVFLAVHYRLRDPRRRRAFARTGILERAAH